MELGVACPDAADGDVVQPVVAEVECGVSAQETD
jgi:hypothetical protein